ncbi:hypothetical protein KAW08_02015 [bacterium]|nr:hypothetical protein [bacterium]
MKKIKAIIFDWGGVLIDNPAPDLMAYCAQTLRVSVEKFEETVFIDDSEEYINGAKAVGLNVILFKSSKQVRKELSMFLSLCTTFSQARICQEA